MIHFFGEGLVGNDKAFTLRNLCSVKRNCPGANW
jgi:hypothetical protein